MSLMRPLTSLNQEMRQLFDDMDQVFFETWLIMGRGAQHRHRINPMQFVSELPIRAECPEKELVVKP